MASSNANPNTFALNEGQNAPINTGTRAQQANGAGSIVAGGRVDVSSTDSRNFGQSFGDIGDGSTVNVTNADPFVAISATNAIRDASLAGLAANLAANQGALDFAASAQQQSGLASLAAISATNDTARAALAANVAAQAEGATLARNASDNQTVATLAALNGNQVATLAALQSTIAGQEQAFGFANEAGARADSTARAAFAANAAGQEQAFTFADSAGARSDATARAALAANVAAQAEGATLARNASDNQTAATLAALNGNQVTTLAALQSTIAGQEQAFGFANDSNRAALSANVAGQELAFTFADSAGARSLDAAKSALAANLTAQQNALTTVQTVNDGAFKLQADTLANLSELDRRRSAETTNTINAATDQAREAAARSESVVQSALTKLADQRAPDGANTVKIVLYIALAFAAIFGIRALRSAKS